LIETLRPRLLSPKTHGKVRHSTAKHPSRSLPLAAIFLAAYVGPVANTNACFAEEMAYENPKDYFVMDSGGDGWLAAAGAGAKCAGCCRACCCRVFRRAGDASCGGQQQRLADRPRAAGESAGERRHRGQFALRADHQLETR